MSEPIKIPAPEVYAHEAKYMEALQRHSEDFDSLVDSIPADREDIRTALRSVYNIEPDRLLNPEKFAELKKQNKLLATSISEYVIEFSKKMLDME